MHQNKIRLLKDSVINQIAAGEVVERPSSVVRELLDNSIDAGATEISVSIVDGGQTSITVTDNGSGLSKDDALAAFERHATSKITSLDDLQTLVTKGFRGEALASIASVSRVRLTSRTQNQTLGTEVFISGGKVVSVAEAACPIGTEFEVRNLFFNTPARKKFLKSPKYEEIKIKDWVYQIALAHPLIRLKVIADGKEIFSAAPCSDSLARSRQLMKHASVPFKHVYDEVGVEGVIGHPSHAGSDSKALVVIVNQRVVSDKTILRAVKDGYSSSLKYGEFPIGVVFITVPGSFVDINVNPQKSEVRFLSSQKVYLAVRTAITEAIKDLRAPIAAAFTFSSTPSPSIAFGSDSKATVPLQHVERFSSTNDGYMDRECKPQVESEFAFSRLRYIGQLLECYLLCEYDDEFYIVDMHAAHERVQFNKIRNAYLSRQPTSQKLLLPLEMSISSEGLEKIKEQMQTLQDIGFVISCADSQIVITEVPSILIDSDLEEVLREIIEMPLDVTGNAPVMRQLDMIASRLACHASIRSGKGMTKEEAYALFDALDGTECSAACPHGRPCIISFTEKQIEHWFGRDR